MNKDIIKLLIAEYQKSVTRVIFQERPVILDDNLNYVFTGLRRVGKSYLMFQQIHHLIRKGHKAEELLYFNFEDDRIDSLSLEYLELIKVSYEEMYDCKPIFFLDEIQIVDGWEKFARRIADQGFRVYITGSNAKMLSSEIATTLGGRYIIQHVFPFSFSEYLTSQGIDVTTRNYAYRYRKEIIRACETYYRFGGLPELTRISDKRAWLSSLYQKIFFGDLISRHQIRNDFALRVLIRKLSENLKQPISFSRLAHVVSSTGKKISTDTVIDYLHYLMESWLIFPMENMSAKLVEKEANKKYYFIDNGILNLFLLDPFTSLLENLVAVHLRRVYGEEVYFYHHGIEVDFYVPEDQLAVQACYTLQDEGSRERETDALLKMSSRIAVQQMIIVTKDEEETITLQDRTIEVIPLWKWLCNLTGNK